ncbi:MAG: phosphodiester glycosidase family protein [Oscillospiraceae bacterium]|nr:phosphodiester glycosidase family protein [Oscillospiraceae bacterium]
MKQFLRRLTALALSASIIFSAAPNVMAVETVNGIGLADGDVLIKKTTTQIAPGVVEHEVITNTAAGNEQKIDYLCEIDLAGTSTTKIVAGYGYNSADSWKLVSTTKQAAAYEKDTGETVVAAINADFFNMATGEPQGALVMDGEIHHAANNRPYFAVLKDGTAVIRYGNDLNDCQTAVGGDVLLVEDGKAKDFSQNGYGELDYSRTAIGIKADGTVVTFVTRGRLYPVSCGRTYNDMAQMFEGMGCVTAMALDGGGSATYCARPEGSDTLAVRNSPSDGAEREVSSSLLIVSTAKATGEFDHAAIAPNNEVYTPGTEVQFTAKGVDGAGAPVDLPEGISWALADDSKALGSISEDGVFTAGAETGVVTVQLIQNDKVVGTTSIEIAVPDQISFSSEEVSLGFEATTDFGIVVRNQGRDLHYKNGDLVWTVTDEKMGTFDGNLFTSSDGESLNGYITATSAFDETVSGTIHVIVGMLPTVVWDFEDHVDEETGDVTPASDYYTGESGILSHSNYGRGGSESIEIVSIDDEEPVRFGSHSLKLNYDFTNCGAVTEGACIGTTDSLSIPGSPTAIGVWVYAPEGTGVIWEGDGTQAGFWLRGYVRDSAGNNMPYDFTLEPKNALVQSGAVQPGIYWEGWHYCEADLTSMTGPFSIQPGMTFRLMFVNGTKMGTRTAGAIYFDNLQFVYGANVDDIDNPVIDSVTANNEPLEDGAVLTTNTVTFDAMFHDVQNKYTSGIDTDTIRMYIDGVNVVGNDNFSYVADPDGTRNHLYDVELLDGQHSITVSLRDKFGNETSETKYFTVNGGGAVQRPTVTVAPGESTAILGESVNLEIRASDAAKIASSTTVLRISNQFPDYEVILSEDYDGSYSFNKFNKTLTVEAERKADAAGTDAVIATVRIPVPTTLNESATFTYSVKAGSYVTDGKLYTYSAAEESLPVEAPYTVSVPPVVVGSTATITVTTSAGTPAAGVPVYLEDGTELGATDENGILETGYFSVTAGKYVIYAKDSEGRVSFLYTVQSYDPQAGEGKPYGIMNNATKDSTTQKSISWLSDPLSGGEQFISYAEGDSDQWTNVAAKQELLTFTKGGNSAAMVNSVILTGLKPETTYRYCVGNNEGWTEEATFTTGRAKTGVDFFVLGDIQAEDLTNINALMGMIQEKDYDFGVQTGDAVDDAVSYSNWADVIGLLGAEKLGDTDVVHVLGNHEYSGDGDSERAAAIYNLPEAKAGSYYSVTYGNVYAAVINYTGTGTQLTEALNWLKEDAANSNAAWKILLMHQPAYYTNIIGGNAEIHSRVPAVAEEVGIDFVFSGHDHSYARTEPLTNGEVDEQNGIVYFICGSSGEKSYTVTDNKDFHFAKLSSDYTGIYLSVSTTRNTFTVNTYEVDGSLLDTYTKTKADPCAAGHKPIRYSDGTLLCDVCGEEVANYTGLATDNATGKEMYYINGVFQTGWRLIGEDMYYFGKDGLSQKVTITEDVPTTCLVRGYCVYTAEDGSTKRQQYAAAAGHEYVEQEDGSFKCSVCGYTRVELKDCTITLPYSSVTYTGNARTLYPTVTAPDGTVLTGHSVDFYVNYKNNTNVGTAQVIVTAKSGFLANLTEYRGNYGGSVTVTFKIVPDLPTALTAKRTSDSTAKLTWTAAGSAPTYLIYQSSNGGTSWKKIGETQDTSYEVTGLSASKEYQYKIRTRVVVDNAAYTSLKYTDPVNCDLMHAHVWDEGKVTTEPTCTEEGVKTYTCSICGETKTEAIAALGHTWDEGKVTTEPTCTEEGVKTYTCSACGETKTEAIAALGHSFTNYVYNNDAKVGVDGTETAVCDRDGCDATDTRIAEGTALPDPNPFVDVKDGIYYEPAVMWAVANNIVAGTSPTTFSPDDICTRAQVVAFLWRNAGRPEPETTNNPFDDVKSSDYYYKAVLWAVENNILYGTTSTTFSPEQRCTRAQVAAFLWRAAGRPEPTTDTNPFTDVPATEYYCKAVIWAAENKIVYGISATEFSPNADCTRAQAVAFLYRAYGK